MRIYGLAEIARELGEKVNTVRAWMYRGKLPAPTEKLKGGHVWQGEEIESWINDRKGASEWART